MVNDTLFYKNPHNGLKRAVFDFQVNLAKIILQQEHENSGHIGIRRMTSWINEKFYGISAERVALFVKSCQGCLRYNDIQTVQPVHINQITKKYDRYMMDCVDLRKYVDVNDGYSWILNVMDTYPKYLWSFKLLNKTSIAVKECLKFIFDNFGESEEIQSDNGKEFKNQLLKDFLLNRNIKIIHGRPRNPKAQGQVERLNQTIERWLSRCIYQTR